MNILCLIILVASVLKEAAATFIQQYSAIFAYVIVMNCPAAKYSKSVDSTLQRYERICNENFFKIQSAQREVNPRVNLFLYKLFTLDTQTFGFYQKVLEFYKS